MTRLLPIRLVCMPALFKLMFTSTLRSPTVASDPVDFVAVESYATDDLLAVSANLCSEVLPVPG